LKIAVLVWDFVTTGGAERYACEVTRRLAEKHDVHVFSQSWDPAVSDKITYHRIPKWCSKPSWVNQLLFSYFTKRALDDSFDIIHTHDRVTRFHILTIHCPCYRGFIVEKKGVPAKLLVWLSVVTSPRSLAYLWMEKQQFTLRPDRLLIAVSRTVQEDVQRLYRLPESFFRRAYPGVDLAAIDDAVRKTERGAMRRQMGVAPRDYLALFVGTEFKRKGLDTLLAAIARAADLARLRLLVVGGGGGQLERYRRQVTEAGLADRVVFTGLMKEVFAYYAIADVFILPTRSDPCPMAPVEAMASGLATIMSRSPFCGTAEHVKNHEALLLQDPENADELAAALRTCSEANFRHTLGERGKALARTLSWERTTEDTLNAYYQFLGRR